MVNKDEIAEVIRRYIEMLKTPPHTQAEADFHQQVLRNLQGILGAWNALLKSKKF